MPQNQRGFFTSHRPSNSDDLRSGNAASADRTTLGVPIAGVDGQAVTLISLGAPAAAATNNISVAAVITGASDAVIGGVLASGGVATLDVERSLQMVSTNAGDTTQVVTVRGFDRYGAALTEVRTLNGTTIVNFVKTFKRVTRISVSATTAGSLSVGTSTVLGLPYAPVAGGFVGGILNENTADAGTYVAPTRVTSTSTTASVRGTYTPAGALNGANIYKLRYAFLNGPTDVEVFGLAQFSS